MLKEPRKSYLINGIFFIGAIGIIIGIIACINSEDSNIERLTAPIELRQMRLSDNQEGSFFMFFGVGGGSTQEETKMKIFCEYEGAYRFVSLDMNRVNFIIDNKLDKPILKIKYTYHKELSAAELLFPNSGYFGGQYVFYVPDKYFPENFKPVEL